MYGYRYNDESEGDYYCYPGTSVLINLLGIKNNEKLLEVERDVTFARMLELETSLSKEKFDF